MVLIGISLLAGATLADRTNISEWRKHAKKHATRSGAFKKECNRNNKDNQNDQCLQPNDAMLTDLSTIITKGYNCSQTTPHKLYPMSRNKPCKVARNQDKKMQVFRGSFYKLRKHVTVVELYHCKKYTEVLTCVEGWRGATGDVDRTEKQFELPVTEKECLQAAATKLTRWGKLYKIDNANYATNLGIKYHCRDWRRIQEHQTMFTITIWKGFANEATSDIKQTLTETLMNVHQQSVHPAEKPKSIIAWNKPIISPNEWEIVGTGTTHKLGNLLYSGSLALGGIVRLTEKYKKEYLLNNGLLVVNELANQTKGGVERAIEDSMVEFRNEGKQWADGVKVEMDQVISRTMLASAAATAKVNIARMYRQTCRINRILDAMRTHSFRNMPSAGKILNDKPGFVYQQLGELVQSNRCQTLSNFKVIWNRKSREACTLEFPIIFSDNRTAYLNILNREITNVPTRVQCKEIQTEIYVRTDSGGYAKVDKDGQLTG